MKVNVFSPSNLLTGDGSGNFTIVVSGTDFDTGATFRACEDFVDRYKNVKMAGMNYTYFVVPSENVIYKKPYYLNSRIYSCILLSNDIDLRWRGRWRNTESAPCVYN